MKCFLNLKAKCNLVSDNSGRPFRLIETLLITYINTLVLLKEESVSAKEITVLLLLPIFTYVLDKNSTLSHYSRHAISLIPSERNLHLELSYLSSGRKSSGIELTTNYTNQIY